MKKFKKICFTGACKIDDFLPYYKKTIKKYINKSSKVDLKFILNKDIKLEKLTDIVYKIHNKTDKDSLFVLDVNCKKMKSNLKYKIKFDL